MINAANFTKCSNCKSSRSQRQEDGASSRAAAFEYDYAYYSSLKVGRRGSEAGRCIQGHVRARPPARPLPCPVSLCSSAEKQIMRRDGLIFPSSCHCWGLCTLDSHLTSAHYCKVRPHQACVHALLLYVHAPWRFTSVHRAPYSIFPLGRARYERARRVHVRSRMRGCGNL